jgi:hypothetical protein
MLTGDLLSACPEGLVGGGDGGGDGDYYGTISINLCGGRVQKRTGDE